MKTPIVLLMLFLFSKNVFCQPKLSSYSSAEATLFLDFDGQTVAATPWQGGNTFYCAPSGLSDQQITEIFNRVAEDFRPFEINITTDSTVYLSAPLDSRMRMIITPTSEWYTGVGGVSFTGSFKWGDETPAFVFVNRLSYNAKYIAECISHEAGHTLGLSHQSKYGDNCNLITVYNEGQGTGEIGWAPIMGNSYYRNLSSWNNGPTPSGCNIDQDNLSILTSVNGFGYRKDDHSDNPALNPTKISLENETFSADGVISSNTDKDVFELKTAEGGALVVDIVPFSVGKSNTGANLDIKAVLVNEQFREIRTYNPEQQLNVRIDTLVNPGKYFLVISGSGNENASEYGSLGSYSVTGNYSPMRVMDIRELSLKGSVKDADQQLEWKLESDEPISAIHIEVSKDGVAFRELTSVSIAARRFTYSPLESGELFYRLQVKTVSGISRYSNIVSLKSKLTEESISIQSNLVRDRIEINADTQFGFVLADLNGRILKSGTGTTGYNTIVIPEFSGKIFVIRITTGNRSITQRIVRM